LIEVVLFITIHNELMALIIIYMVQCLYFFINKG